MVTSEDPQPPEFRGADLRGARFIESDLSDAVMRGVEVSGMDIDAPWLGEGAGLLINGVDVTAYVEAELDRRSPGRAERRATDPDGLRAAWATLERAWATTVDRVAAMPPGSVDVSVDGEWSFAQTLRHLVHATDVWLGRGVLGRELPFHPLGLGDTSAEAEGLGATDPTDPPPYAEVLEARADRVAMVRDYLAAVTAAVLDEVRHNPHRPDEPETVRSCLHVVLEEEWEHHRFAVRDLDAIAAATGGP